MSIYDKSSLVLIPSGTKTGKVFSQKPVSGDGDFTFTRSSAATRVNADGNIEKETQNLLLQSNNLTTTWGATGGTMVGGQADKDGGTDAWVFTANSAGQSRFNQTISVSGVNTISMYAKAGTANFLCLYIIGSGDPRAFFNLSTGAVGSTGSHIDANIEDVGNGWYRCSLTFDRTSSTLWCFVANTNGDFNSAIGDSIYIQDAQLEQGLVARDVITTTTSAVYGGITDNVPRLDYTDSSCPALLLEPQRTNLVAYANSLHFTLGRSTRGAATNRKGVDGFLYSDNGSGNPNINNNWITYAQGFHSFSIFIDSANSDYFKIHLAADGSANQGVFATFTPSTKSWNTISEDTNYVVSGSGFVDYKDMGNGIFRLTIGGNFNNPSSSYFFPIVYFGTGTSDVFIGGLQLEAGSYATSYIPTYGSSVSRVQDSFYNNGYQANNIFGTNSGSIFFDFGDDFTIFDGVSNSSPTDLFQFVDVTSYGGGYMRFRGGETNHYLQLVSMGAADNSLSFTDQTKYCICWDSNGVDFYGNGALIQSTTITNVPSFDRLERGITGNGREGRVKEMLFFTTKLSSQEAIDLTTI